MKYLPLFFLLAMAACSAGPKPIEYGTDKCAHCYMTIVDRQHAAQAVTAKGKVYSFDAIECLVPYVREKGPETFASLWINDYTTNTGELIDATTATYLISPNIPSPMGGFLSGFASEQTAREFQAEKSGELFDWPGLMRKLNE
jgi:copper chaperone NosL